MPIFEFTTTFAIPAGTETEEVALTDTLYDAGCTDALVGLGGLPDKLALDFCREAATLDGRRSSRRSWMSSGRSPVAPYWKLLMPTLDVDLVDRLPSDITGYIGSAKQSYDIAPDTAIWARFFCPNIQRLIENRRYLYDLAPGPDVTPETSDAVLAVTGAKLERVFLDWVRSVKVPLEHKQVCVGIGVKDIPRLITEVGDWVADLCVWEDDPKRYRIGNNYAPQTKVSKKYGERNPDHEDGNYRIQKHYWQPFFDDEEAKPRKATQLLVNMANRAALVGPLPERIRYTWRSQTQRPWMVGTGIASQSQRRYVRRQRQILRKGIDLLADLVPYDELRAFLSMKAPLLIPGEHVTFRVTLERLGGGSHGGSKTEVLVNGERACNLCVYTPDTPIIDHVASLIVHTRAGCESEIVTRGNPYDVVATKPCGIDFLDKRLKGRYAFEVREAPLPDVGDLEPCENPEPFNAEEFVRRITVRRPDGMPVIRIGPSKRTRRIRQRLAHRIGSYIYKTYIPDFHMPDVVVRHRYQGVVVRGRRPDIIDMGPDEDDGMLEGGWSPIDNTITLDSVGPFETLDPIMASEMDAMLNRNANEIARVIAQMDEIDDGRDDVINDALAVAEEQSFAEAGG